GRPDLRGRRQDLRTDRLVLRVGEAAALAGSGLDVDRVPGLHQRVCTRRHQSDPVLGGLDLLHNTDQHRNSRLRANHTRGEGQRSGPSRTALICSGARKLAAISAVSSCVTASTSRSNSSGDRYGSSLSACDASRDIRAVVLSSASISWPLSCPFASARSSAGNPSLATRRNSDSIASIARSAVDGWVPTYTPNTPPDR